MSAGRRTSAAGNVAGRSRKPLSSSSSSSLERLWQSTTRFTYNDFCARSRQASQPDSELDSQHSRQLRASQRSVAQTSSRFAAGSANQADQPPRCAPEPPPNNLLRLCLCLSVCLRLCLRLCCAFVSPPPPPPKRRPRAQPASPTQPASSQAGFDQAFPLLFCSLLSSWLASELARRRCRRL